MYSQKREGEIPMKKWMIRTLSALLIVAFLPTTVLAAEWNLDNGSIEITATGTTQTVSQGGSSGVEDSNPIITSNNNQTSNTVTIKADDGTTANVTIKDTNIDTSGTDNAAIKTEGDGSVNLNVEGTNTVTSGDDHAGVEKSNEGNLTIGSESGEGKLTAKGGENGAGIGGGNGGNGSHITITGGEVTAKGGYSGAGIGGGSNGDGDGGNGSDITITGGKVTATGGMWAAGIGGGKSDGRLDDNDGKGSDITMSGGEVTAKGGYYSAGIGGGYCGNGSNITISGGEVTATGGENGAGIGGGHGRNGSEITISGGEVTAKGGDSGAGIGGGRNGKGCVVNISRDSQVKATGGAGTSWDGCGAAFGDGGGSDDFSYVKFDGREIDPNIFGLYTTGQVERTRGDGAVLDTIVGTVEPPKPDEPENSASAEEEEPLYWVLHLDWTSLEHQEQKADGVLALTAKADGAILTGKLRGLRVLQNQGIEKITFTDGTHSAELVLADLIAKGQPEAVYVLTLGAENTLTLNGKAIDF